jgi:hypothetical protein
MELWRRTGARYAGELKREQPSAAFHALRRLMAWAYPGTVNGATILIVINARH